jgi:hypothetical protein
MNPPPRFHSRPSRHEDRLAALDLLPPWLALSEPVRRALPDFWAQMDGTPVLHQAMEDLAQPPATRLQAWGVTIGLPQRWVERLQLHDTPPADVSRRVYEALYDGELAPMSERELGLENARGTLVLLNLHFSMRVRDLDGAYARGLLTFANEVFRDAHAGYHLQAMFFQGGELDEPYLVAAGFRARRCADAPALEALPAVQRPALFGLTRAEAMCTWPGTSVRHIFDHQPPRFGLSSTQRRALTLALQLDSDPAVMERLAISPHALKKLWRVVYERIEDRAPGFFGETSSDDEGKRGPEKRRQVLAYVRQRPEELCPWVEARSSSADPAVESD